MICKNFLPFSGVPFQGFNNVICSIRFLILIMPCLFFLLLFLLWVWWLRNHCLSPDHKHLFLFSPKSLIVLVIIFRLLALFEVILCTVWGGDPISFFCMWISSFPTPFVVKILFSSLSGLGTVKNQLTVNVRVYFWPLYSILSH